MIMKYRDKEPKIDESCFVAHNATIIGDVTLQKDASVFFGTIVRGDKNNISIGEGSNIQDNCTLHSDPGHHLVIGKHVTVGHSAILHGAFIDDEVLIGMGAIVLNGAHIGKHSIIGAGALISENQEVPENSLVVGVPGRIIKTTTQEQRNEILENAVHYAALAKEYKEMK
ncbi:MAG: gamma carbonic anhydrase family protein, partial [Longicatena sp.]